MRRIECPGTQAYRQPFKISLTPAMEDSLAINESTLSHGRQTRVSGNHTHDGDLLDIAILVLEQDYPIVLR